MPRSRTAARIAGVLFLSILPSARTQAAYPPPLVAHKAAVATDHPVASEGGLLALREGGTAMDAGCRAALLLGIVSPSSSGIGGGGFLLYYRAKDKSVTALDFRERAPARATAEAYEALWKARPEEQRNELTRTGPLAVAVPGEIAGLSDAVKRWGKLGWRRCVEPAAARARQGAAISVPTATAIEKTVGSMSPTLAAFYAPHGKPLVAGALVRRPDLARTLERIARNPRIFYEGDLAREIAASVSREGGLLTERDLADYKVKVRTPLEGTYRGYRVVTMPPPSSGGVAALETLNLLELHDLAELGHGSSAYLHLVAESLKHAFADRARHLGDPDAGPIPVADLLSKAYAKHLSTRIRPDRVGPRDSYGSPAPATLLRDGGTTHLTVVDAEGNWLVMTTTINGYFGARMLAGTTGILLNNHMDDFSPPGGKPNAYGLVTSAHNAIAPGRTPLSSMTPVLVFDGDRPWIGVGASGGPRIITATVQALLAAIDFAFDAAEAVDAPRIHTQWLPEQLEVEPFVPRDVSQSLIGRGHVVRPIAFPGIVQMIIRTPRGLEAASDPRKQGAPAGY